MRTPTRLSRKLLAGLGLGLCMASLVFLALFIENYRNQLSMERANASAQVNRLLQVSLENAMLKRDLPGLQDIIDRLAKQPGIARVAIINPQREVRFSSDQSVLHSTLPYTELGCPECQSDSRNSLSASSQIMTLAGGREVLRSVNPIRNREPCKGCHGEVETHPVNGILVVDHDAGGIRAEAMRAAAMMSGAGIVVVLFGMATVWWVLKRHVLSPISALDDMSRSLTMGDLNARVKIEPSRNDELADLCKSFNGMAATIEKGVREIREKEAFLKTLIDTVPDGVRVIDENYNVIMANGSYARQSRMDIAELVGVSCYAIQGRKERCPATLITCPFHAIEADGAPIKYTHRHVRGDGSEVYVEITAARVSVDADGARKVLIIEAIRDLEQQLKYSHEQRLSEIGQLAAGVAHEIYNPLASVRLGLQAVLRRARAKSNLEPETEQYLAMVDGEVDKCIDVTKRLLNLSQLPSSSIQLVSFSTIVPEVVSLLTYDAEHRGVKIGMDFGVEDLRVFATDSDLRMLVLNLVQNAFHAMPAGGTLTITGKLIDGKVSVTFADTGVGIAPDVLARIFEPFFSRRADGVQGTGLGLTICKAIANRYDGTIEAESQVGTGTTFRVEFPLASSAKELE